MFGEYWTYLNRIVEFIRPILELVRWLHHDLQHIHCLGRKLITLMFSFHLGGFRLNSLFPPPLTTPGIPIPILPWEYSTCYVASFIRRELSNRSVAVFPTSSAFPPTALYPAPPLRYTRQDSGRAQNSRRDSALHNSSSLF